MRAVPRSMLASVLFAAVRPPRALFSASLLRPRAFAAPLACATAQAEALLGPRLRKWLGSSLEAERRKQIALAKEAEAARSAERLAEWATLVVANLWQIDDRATSAVVEDWNNGGAKVKLSFAGGQGTPREQADAAFAKARRLRRGSAVVAELIRQSEAVEARLQGWQARLADGGGGAEDEELFALRAEVLKEAKKLKLKPAPLAPSQTSGWGGREFVSPAGVPILVGRNRKENEQLSLRVAREPDVWMHVRGVPGAHVLLQMSRVKGKAPPAEACLQMAADLAAFYSEARDERKALVTYASPRHVTKPNGAPLGAVKLREEGGTIVGRPVDSELIPPEVLGAREAERFGGKG
ncbi:hypothetical protein EMIHUDRAFT_216979 [Emiliania huxleyi CCMP1516]|uniref:NFACT RNA-binding domain-containing protein n=2 Tax=Emiliania huxleyi TaxID=2903 RepID=A0A0D3ICX6_EMIH1|nr:hypothetical protein EMIHUDRAFT_216979 [Emiliania huxleyi CCMP1516]EOD09111.1 hypothetical protein EMIHUDRAFT_216979 [Emiliania huxleyi CCMP1516]|eukprot:XP_005761540.1 hypothetical protein EMIHUDRAFT_216979 [Emiliania huxleyi CCMP1516]